MKKGMGLGRVLVVESNPDYAEALDDCLLPMGYDVIHAYDGREALLGVEADGPDLVLLGLELPEEDAYDVCRRVRANDSTKRLPIIIAPSGQSYDRIQGLEAGADDFITKPFDKVELLARIGSLLRLKRVSDELEAAKEVLFSLVFAIESKDVYYSGHSRRVAVLAEQLGRWKGLTPETQRAVHTTGLLHDIGKAAINNAICLKSGPLSWQELQQVREHTIEGERLCRPFQPMRLLLPAVRHHHERYDGSGYPDRLRGEEIPEVARILAVVDAYDAMTSARPYRPPMTREQTVLTLLEGAGRQWDPELVHGFVTLARESTD